MALRHVLVAAALAGCAGPGAPALSGAQMDAVLRAVLAAGSCPGASAEVADPPVRLDDPRLGPALRQAVRVEGCGRSGRLNMLVAAAGVAPLLPGTTAADPLAQREGLRLAVLAVKDAAPGCDRVAVNDTRADGGAGAGAGAAPGGRAARPWAETWTLSACGRAYAVPVRFAPDRSGATEITVDPGAVRPLPA